MAMNYNLSFNKNYKKWFLTSLLMAEKKYEMIQTGEEVCVALSGGKDSITLLFMLRLLQLYSHLRFELSALHIKTADYNTDILSRFCTDIGIDYFEESLEVRKTLPDPESCYICARLKRGAMSNNLEKRSIKKIAYGHHADDVAETLFMNMIQTKKLGSFSPRVSIEQGEMVIIRPMIYLEEKDIRRVHSHFNLPLLDYSCPNESKNLRTVFKKGVLELNSLFQTDHISKKIVDSLENLDTSNLWKQE
jgi:tRNA 2-thiocytidine biosynthesis protein TtcA